MDRIKEIFTNMRSYPENTDKILANIDELEKLLEKKPKKAKKKAK